MIDDTAFTWVGSVSTPSDTADREEVEEALEYAKEYLSDVKEMESIARSCQRGWDDRIEELEVRLRDWPDEEEEEEPEEVAA